MRDNGDTYFRPGVNDVKEVASWIGFPDGLEHLLVFQAPGTEAGQGLAAPADGGLRGEAMATRQCQTTVHPDLVGPARLAAQQGARWCLCALFARAGNANCFCVRNQNLWIGPILGYLKPFK